jgi:hypothetical protein
MAAVKTAKTLLAQIWLPWIVCNAPGSMLWLMQVEQAAELISETKTLPVLLDCPPVAVHLPKNTDKIRKDEIIFPHMSVTLTSAKESLLQSSDMRYVVMDDCYLYKNGFIEEASDRIRGHIHHSKILRMSQGGQIDDEWDKYYKRGIVFEWGYKCKCGKENIHTWQMKREDGSYSGMNWLKNETTYPNGVRSNSECAKTAHLECHHCKNKLFDTDENREYLRNNGIYICTKKNGNELVHSYHWPSWAMFNVTFESAVLRYLNAKDEADSLDDTALNNFYKKELGIPRPIRSRDNLIYTMIEDYDPNKVWDSEETRFLSADVQRTDPMFRWIVRAMAKNGDSRLIELGTAVSWDELRNVQTRLQVKDQNVVIDSGDGNLTEEVYEKCVQYGHEGFNRGKKTYFCWFALKGDKAITYNNHSDHISRPYSSIAYKPITNPKSKGKMCPLILWSNYTVKNILSHLRSGKSSIKWVSNKIDDEYERQMNAEVLIKETNKTTGKVNWRWDNPDKKPNHYWDVECQLVVAGLARGILGRVGDIEKKPIAPTPSTIKTNF